MRKPDSEPAATVPHLTAAAPAPVRPRGVWWAWHGLHGGAGVTTLAAAIPGGIDGPGLPYQHGFPALPVVAVCRSNAGGLTDAQHFAKWASDNAAAANVIGLVVVADAPGRLPRSLESAIRLVTGGYPQLWRVPWVQSWRVGVPPSAATLPTAGRQLHIDLASRTGAPLNGGHDVHPNLDPGPGARRRRSRAR